MLKDPLEQKFFEYEREQERQRLIERMGKVEEQLGLCEQGKCPEAGVSQDECLLNPDVGCLCPPDEQGRLFCEYLKQELSHLEDALAIL